MKRELNTKIVRILLSICLIFLTNTPILVTLNINFKNLFYIPSFSRKFDLANPAYAQLSSSGTYSFCNQDSLTTKTEVLPSARYVTSAVWDTSANKAYIFGGTNISTNFDQIVEYIPSSGTTIVKPETLPSPRRGASAIWDPVSNKAYLFGGYNLSTYFNQIVEYTPSTGMVVLKSETLPSGRDGTTSVWDPVNQKAYIFGGFNVSYLNQIVEYTPSTGSVVVKSETLPQGLYCASAVWDPIANKAYIIGGYNNGTPTNQIVEYTPSTGMVVVKSETLPVARYAAAAVWNSVLGNAYIFGGFNNTTSTFFNQVVEYNPLSGNVAVKTPTFPTSRVAPSAVAIPNTNTAYIFGGYDGSPKDLIHEYNACPGSTSLVLQHDARNINGLGNFADNNDVFTTWTDLTSNLNNGVLMNFTLVANSVSGWDGTNTKCDPSVLKYDGVDDYVDAGISSSLQIPGALALEAWIKPIGLAAGTDAGIAGTGIYNYQLTYHSDGQVWFYINDGANNVKTPVSPNNWHHIVGTWDGTTNANGMRLYVDGVLSAQGTSAQSSISGWTNFLTGKATTNFKGHIAKVRVYNSSLTSQQVLQNYLLDVVNFPDGSCSGSSTTTSSSSSSSSGSSNRLCVDRISVQDESRDASSARMAGLSLEAPE